MSLEGGTYTLINRTVQALKCYMYRSQLGEVMYGLITVIHSQRIALKVYLRHHDATPADLESALSAARNYVSGDAIEFCQAMAPGQTSFSQKPAITCFSLIEEDNAIPSNGTLYLPISNYALDDRVVCDRVDLYFIQHGLPVSTYQLAIQALTTRSLEAGVGMHSYTSLRREQQHKRVTLYLNPEVNTLRHRGQISELEPARSLPSRLSRIYGDKYCLF